MSCTAEQQLELEHMSARPFGGSSVTIDPPSWPTIPTLPTTISASHPPASNQLTGTQTLVNGQWVKPPQKLLWADLDGQAIAPDLSTFIKTDLFGCQATREYDAADDTVLPCSAPWRG